MIAHARRAKSMRSPSPSAISTKASPSRARATSTALGRLHGRLAGAVRHVSRPLVAGRRARQRGRRARGRGHDQPHRRARRARPTAHAARRPGRRAVLDEALDLAARTATLQRLAPVCGGARRGRVDRAAATTTSSSRPTRAFALAAAKRHPWFLGELAFWQWRVGRLLARRRPAAPSRFACRWTGAGRRRPTPGPRWAARTSRRARSPMATRPAQRGARRSSTRSAPARSPSACASGMRQAGVRAVPRGALASTRANAAGLTTRELQVLALAGRRTPQRRDRARPVALGAHGRPPRRVDPRQARRSARAPMRSRAARRRGLLAGEKWVAGPAGMGSAQPSCAEGALPIVTARLESGRNPRKVTTMPRYLVERTFPSGLSIPQTEAGAQGLPRRRSKSTPGRRQLGSFLRHPRQGQDVLHLRWPVARGDPQGRRAQQAAGRPDHRGLGARSRTSIAARSETNEAFGQDGAGDGGGTRHRPRQRARAGERRGRGLGHRCERRPARALRGREERPHGAPRRPRPAAIAALFEQLPALDVLFNCAGIVHNGTTLEATDEELDLAFRLNVRAQLWTIQAALPKMLAAGRGSIINMASIARASRASRAAACTARQGGGDRPHQGRRRRLRKQGIRCNALCPGTVDTPSLAGRINAYADPVAARQAFVDRQPMGRLASPRRSRRWSCTSRATSRSSRPGRRSASTAA